MVIYSTWWLNQKGHSGNSQPDLDFWKENWLFFIKKKGGADPICQLRTTGTKMMKCSQNAQYANNCFALSFQFILPHFWPICVFYLDLGHTIIESELRESVLWVLLLMAGCDYREERTSVQEQNTEARWLGQWRTCVHGRDGECRPLRGLRPRDHRSVGNTRNHHYLWSKRKIRGKINFRLNGEGKISNKCL